MSKELAFVVPTANRGNHFTYTAKLINSWVNTGNCDTSDIFIVMSSYEEKQIFISLFKSMFPDIDIQMFRMLTFPHSRKKIINYPTCKKYWGMLQIYKNYKYVICMDDETSFVRNLTIDKLDRLWEEKEWWGSNINMEDRRGISNTSASVMFPKHVNELKKITEDWTMYTWWSNVPVYKTEDLDDYFNNFVLKHPWETLPYRIFDHIPYVYYLLLFKGWTLKNASVLYPSTYIGLAGGGDQKSGLEFLTDPRIIRDSKTLWSSTLRPENIQNGVYENICLLFHMDRLGL